MYKRWLTWATLLVAFAFVLTVGLPLQAQGPWPPIALGVNPIVTGKRLTFEIKVTNQVEWDLTDFILKADIPADTVFVEGHGDFDGAAVSFDGQEVTFSLVNLPVGATLGYRYTVEHINGSAPIYPPQVWVSWKGRLPGQFLFNSGQEPIATPSAAAANTIDQAAVGRMSGIDTVHVHGNAYEQGFERGKVLDAEIKEQVNTQLAAMLPKAFNGSPQEWLEAIHAQIPQVAPAVLDELRGLADGSGVPVNDLEIVNFAEYVMPPGEVANAAPLNTVIAATNGATRNTTPLIGWNQSLKYPDIAPALVVRHFSDTQPPRIDLVQPASLEPMLSITGSGLFWLGYPVPSKETVPAHATDIISLLSESLLKARTLDELQQALLAQPRLKPMNMIVASLPQNKVRILELSYNQYAERQPDAAGLLISADHFSAPGLQGIQPPTINRSSTRYEWLLAQAQALPAGLTREVLQGLLHDPQIWDGQGLSFVMDATGMRLSVWNPTAQAWDELALENLFTEQSPVQ